MSKKCIVTSIYHNDPLKKVLHDRLHLMFQEFAEKCEADFIDYKDILDCEAVNNVYSNIKGKGSSDWSAHDKKMTQLNKLSIFNDVFEKGYDWAVWLDADMVIHPEATTIFPEGMGENCIYWLDKETVNKRIAAEKFNGPNNFKNCLKVEYRGSFPKYGNAACLMIHREAWEKIAKCMSEVDIFDYVEDVDLFMTHCEQATLSLVANILKIETGPHPSDWPAYYMFHMIGNHVFEYLNIKKSSVQAVPDSKKYIKRIIMADMLSKIDEGTLDLKKWFKQKK